MYAHYVFNAMFSETLRNNGGVITFNEYAMALSVLCRGSTQEKLEWIFRLYDTNQDGKITLDEVTQISTAIYALLGCNVAPQHDESTYAEHATRVFAKLDVNNVGYVTFEQFKSLCEQVCFTLNRLISSLAERVRLYIPSGKIACSSAFVSCFAFEQRNQV